MLGGSSAGCGCGFDDDRIMWPHVIYLPQRARLNTLEKISTRAVKHYSAKSIKVHSVWTLISNEEFRNHRISLLKAL